MGFPTRQRDSELPDGGRHGRLVISTARLTAHAFRWVVILLPVLAGAAELPPSMRERIELLRNARKAVWVDTHAMLPGTLVILGLEPDQAAPETDENGVKTFPKVELYWVDGVNPDAPCHHGRMLEAYIAWREKKHAFAHTQLAMELSRVPEYTKRNIDETLYLIDQAYRFQVPKAVGTIIALSTIVGGGGTLIGKGLTVIVAEATLIEFIQGSKEGNRRYREIVEALDASTLSLNDLLKSNRVLGNAPVLEKDGVLFLGGRMKDAYAAMAYDLPRFQAFQRALVDCEVKEPMITSQSPGAIYGFAARNLRFVLTSQWILKGASATISTKTRGTMQVLQTQTLVHLYNAHALSLEARKKLDQLRAQPSAQLIDEIAALTTRAYQDLEVAFFLMAVVMRHGTSGDIFGWISSLLHDLVNSSDPVEAKITRLLEFAKNWDERWKRVAGWTAYLTSVGASVVRYAPLFDQSTRYRVEDLGVPGGGILITQRGQVVMRLLDGGCVIWDRGQVTPVPFAPAAVNDNGRMCGPGTGKRISIRAGGKTYLGDTGMAHVWNAGALYRLPPAQFNTTFATDLNNLGYVVGAGGNRDPRVPGPASTRALLWAGGERGAPVDLGPGEASAINEVGQIVGNTVGRIRGGDKPRGFLWQRGQMTFIDGPFGTPCDPADINNNGLVVGSFRTSAGSRRAFYWQAGRSVDLGVLESGDTIACAVNNRGLIVGNGKLQHDRRHACIWREERIADLNTLIGVQSERWTLEFATGINDAGQIVGIGLLDGQKHHYLLMPAPGPAPQQ